MAGNDALEGTGASTYTLPNGFELVEYITKQFLSPRESYEVDGSRVTAMYRCDWEDRQEAVLAILGYSEDTGAGGILRVPPWGYPDAVMDPTSPVNSNWLSASKVLEIKPLGVNDDGDGPKYAILTVEFSSLDWDVPASPRIDDPSGPGNYYLVKRVRPACQFIGAPTSFLRFNSGGVSYDVPDSSSGHKVPYYDVTLRWVQVPESAIGSVSVNPEASFPDTIDARFGLVNDATFFGLPPQSCLLAAMSYDPARLPTGVRAFDVTFDFTVNLSISPPPALGSGLVGWNQIIGRNTGVPQNVVRKATPTVGLYDQDDMTEIFH